MNELLLTFTASKGKYSSKKIERFVCFMFSVLIIITYYFLSIFYQTKISSAEVIMLSGVLLTYGGFNTKQLLNDKKVSNE